MSIATAWRRFGQYVADRRWATNVEWARAWRRDLTPAQRLVFDDVLRPQRPTGEILAYPEALYCVTVDDVIRAATAARLYAGQPNPRAQAEAWLEVLR